MKRYFKSNRIECQCSFTIQTLENVPYMEGKFYALVSSAAGSYKSSIVDVSQHEVQLNFASLHVLKCTIPYGGNEVEPEYIKCKIYHCTSSKVLKLGRVVINISEYLAESFITKRFLLQDAKENITVLCSLGMSTSSYDAQSDADSIYTSSAQPTPHVMDLKPVDVEKILPSTGRFRTVDEELEALLDPNYELVLTHS